MNHEKECACTVMVNKFCLTTKHSVNCPGCTCSADAADSKWTSITGTWAARRETVKSDGWSTSYYELPEGAKEVQDLIEHRNMNFAVANIFKACYRLGKKDGADALYDMRKILWFANRELARLQGSKPKQEIDSK